MNWSMMSAERDGRSHHTMLGARVYGDGGSWYSLTAPIVLYLYRDMGCLPELAPYRKKNPRVAVDLRPRSVSYLAHQNEIHFSRNEMKIIITLIRIFSEV